MIATLKIAVQDWNDAYDDWALPIGRFIVSFTNLEFWALMCIRAFGSVSLEKSCADMSIEPRSKIAEGLMLKADLTDAEKSRVEAAFTELRRLAVQRNLVAHNAPMLNLYQSGDGKIRFERELRSLRNHKKLVTKRDLAALHKSAVELGGELFNLLQEFAPRK